MFMNKRMGLMIMLIANGCFAAADESDAFLHRASQERGATMTTVSCLRSLTRPDRALMRTVAGLPGGSYEAQVELRDVLSGRIQAFNEGTGQVAIEGFAAVSKTYYGNNMQPDFSSRWSEMVGSLPFTGPSQAAEFLPSIAAVKWTTSLPQPVLARVLEEGSPSRTK